QRGDDQIFVQGRRKNQNVAGILDQRRETRDAERHQKETKDLPPIQLGFAFDRTASANDEGRTDNRAQSERGEPEPTAQLEMSPDVNRVPDRVAPQDDPSHI